MAIDDFGSKKTYLYILIVLCVMLLILPFITTFNEFLTKLVETSQAYKLIQNYIVPFQVRMVSLILKPFGLESEVTRDSLVFTKTANPIFVYISWNCIGWQSFVLLLISFITGLQGKYQFISKIYCIFGGILGTFWVNLLRITVVALVAYFFGQAPAIIFHDYFSTFLIIGWLLLFWKISFNYLLY